MIQVYNHFITEHSSRLTARSSAHMQKELKEIYNRIRKSNQNSAFYKLDISNDKQRFSVSLKDTAMVLSSNLKELSGTFQKPAIVRDAQSSDPDAVSVSLMQRESSRFTKPYDINVEQVAVPQVNTGRMVSSDAAGPALAAYRFMIHTAEGSYEFSYNVNNFSTNRELMDKLSNFINQSDIHIHASVEEDTSSNSCRIVLASEDTGVLEGETTRFTIEDSSESSSSIPGLVSYFGLDQVAQMPENARFSVNGSEKTSSRNNFVIDRSLSVTLHKPTATAVHITPATAGQQVTEEVKDFLDTYNGMVRLSYKGLSGNRRSARLQYELNHIVSSDLEALENAGLRWNPEDSTLSLADGTFENPEAMQHMKELFEEPDGILAQLSRKAQDIVVNPMEYVDKIIITYPNTSRANFSNPYTISIYSGMFFNSYC